MKRPNNDMKKQSRRLSLGMSDDEYESFQDEATKRGISLCGFLRESAHFQIEKRELKNNGN